MLSRRTILLKSMQPALSGYARMQTDSGRTLIQLHARGLEEGEDVTHVMIDDAGITKGQSNHVSCVDHGTSKPHCI